MKKKIGAITIGQAPRTDVTGDLLNIFGDNIELIEAGALDGLSKDEIATFKPESNDYVLISRLTDGSSVVFAERFILPFLQKRIDELEAQGVSLILFFCTGEFPDNFRSTVPLIFPYKILNGLVPALTTNSNIAIITPKEEQVEQTQAKWKDYANKVTVVAGSPYGEREELLKAAETLKGTDADLIVMDCIGYNVEMKHLVAEITGKNVILSRTILARVATELLE